MSLIFSTGVHDSEEIAKLRDEINARDTAFEDAKRAHHREQLERLDRYDALLASRRPTYPTREHLAGFDQIRAIVHDDGAYGDLHGHPSAADKLAGRTLPSGVHFSASSGRINVYAGAPFKVRTSERAWAFTPEDVTALRNELKKRSLRIEREWIHEDGIAFVVVDGRV